MFKSNTNSWHEHIRPDALWSIKDPQKTVNQHEKYEASQGKKKKNNLFFRLHWFSQKEEEERDYGGKTRGQR